jgi:hypothetical protein
MAASATSARHPKHGGSPNRLWFHLDDVLPLAAHAAGTNRHSITREQLVAHAPILPALIWNNTSGADTLASNGDPGWYDPNGRPHIAASRSWVHPATGRRGTTPAGSGGYLPLRSVPNSGFHVIDWLQQAAAAGGHWLSVDLTRPRPVIGADQLDIRDQRGDLYPPDVTWAPATVACVPTTGSGTYPALVADGYRNTVGGEIARFDTDIVTRMIIDLDSDRVADGYRPGSRAVLRWSGDRVEVFEHHAAGGIPGLRRYDVIGPDAEGRYPIGAHLWPWLRTGAEGTGGAA